MRDINTKDAEALDTELIESRKVCHDVAIILSKFDSIQETRPQLVKVLEALITPTLVKIVTADCISCSLIQLIAYTVQVVELVDRTHSD